MQTRLLYLFDRFRDRSITSAEREELALLLRDAANEEEVKEWIDKLASGEVPHYPMDETAAGDILEAVLKTPLPARPAKKISLFRTWHWAAAALVLMIGTYFLGERYLVQKTPGTAQTKDLIRDIAPGKDGAILTLDDGSQLVLDSLQNGNVAVQNGARLTLHNGQLTYSPSAKAAGELVYNTITTPRGRQFRVTLPDGSRVWLNAASSIRYPANFPAHERKVDITGEVYFEVARDAAAPFLVNINNKADIEVLGTSFNINAYENEEHVTTTLLTGSLRIKKDGRERILRPGQQASLLNNIQVTENTDLGKVVAWKDGFFDFSGVDLEHAMRQIARWYEVEVVYAGKVPNVRFYGRISRDISLAGLIRGLNSTTDANMKISEGKLIISQ
ncbi:FecR domain-containing protein [Chitinophaga sp. YIM B06452]|uniref:FecR family protein n=1 Tax=Chitinophaga sp. YIM B06452 TaxID=3082158 RepID=UPI0031FE5750